MLRTIDVNLLNADSCTSIVLPGVQYGRYWRFAILSLRIEAVNQSAYDQVRSGGVGFYEQPRGLITVWGKEAVQFLDGMITNDMKTLGDGEQMLAAFPNAQGRLLAVVRVKRMGDRFLIETEEATREKVFQNLYRFTFAGDFFVGDTSELMRCIEVFGKFAVGDIPESFVFDGPFSKHCFIPSGLADGFVKRLVADGGLEIAEDVYETLRIENGIPKYGADMDETTIVPEIGLSGMISYNKGCYIGQEIIARIHFRGHVAKRLTGLILSEPGAVATGFLHDGELTTPDGKNAGRVTSAAFSPSLGSTIALGYVRYDYLTPETGLKVKEIMARVVDLPFITN